MELDSALSNEKQNLIFARNGTGKSFLSSAFRYIAEYKKEGNSEDIAERLVSEEAPGGIAKLEFFGEAKELAKLTLNSQSKLATPNVDNSTIFHVFSEDFVEKELRQKGYNLDGNITHKITVGSENIALEDAREKCEKTKDNSIEETQALKDTLEQEKETELKSKADINAGLTEYKGISIESCFIEEPPPELPTSDKLLDDIIGDLDKLKSTPSIPSFPEGLEQLSLKEIPVSDIQKDLEKLISPAKIAEELKVKLDKDSDFYRVGTKLINENPKTCPLCEQSLENEKTKEIIDAYVAYFNDEEAKAKERLRGHWKLVNDKIKIVKNHEQNTNRQEKKFNNLKQYIPSQSKIDFENIDEEYKKIIDILINLRDTIELKGTDLSKEHKTPNNDLSQVPDILNQSLENNNKKTNSLRKIYDNINKERQALQRQACGAFIKEFRKRYKIEIDSIKALRLKFEEQSKEINRLEREGASDDAKGRVSAVLEMLFPYFFQDKYSFDKESFTIKMNNKNPARGIPRTLSDGEKSVMAFCYFIAMIHLKVENNNEYKKLFLIFDDPVTSMSYDFVFSIVQLLKDLGISGKGEISINSRKKDDGFLRPRLLVLTHNSYFFNIAATNKVVKPNATFSLDKSGNKHFLSKLDKYIVPFTHQLKDVMSVAKGSKNPDHTTANSVRSVLDAIHRFCFPDRNLNMFCGYVGQEKGIKIKSVLINHFSHGRAYEAIMATPSDLKQACEEIVDVARIFIPGQVQLIEKE